MGEKAERLRTPKTGVVPAHALLVWLAHNRQCIFRNRFRGRAFSEAVPENEAENCPEYLFAAIRGRAPPRPMFQAADSVPKMS